MWYNKIWIIRNIQKYIYVYMYICVLKYMKSTNIRTYDIK